MTGVSLNENSTVNSSRKRRERPSSSCLRRVALAVSCASCLVMTIIPTLVVGDSSSSSMLRGSSNHEHQQYYDSEVPHEVRRQLQEGLLVEDEEKWQYPMQPHQLERPLNILAFGGSVTWGAMCEDRLNRAYPYLMGYPHHVDHVDNMAMRATGADYPSLCLESIIPDSANKNYDVIMFDFVLNGTDGFPLLLKRLKQRYPDAVIIYVHIWSIVNLARDAETLLPPHPKSPDFQPNRNWEWKSEDTFNPGSTQVDDCGREICGKEQMEKLVTEAGGYVWHMPRPPTVAETLRKGWFSNDWHHLSAYGHQMVANQLLAFLQTIKEDVFKPKRLGTFGMGDQCWNWFESGNVDLDYWNAEPHNLLKNAPNADAMKMTLEIQTSEEGGFIGFDSKFDRPVPVGLAYMSIRQPDDYPKVQVTLNSVEHQEPVVIDPAYNNGFADVHIVVYAHVGWALPGRNSLSIKPLQYLKPNPFRVVGVYLCGECAQMGDMGNGAVNSPGYSGPLEDLIEKRMQKQQEQQTQ